MAKFSLTPTGVEAFTAQLYKYSNDNLKSEAVLLASDPRAYIAAHFELPVNQLECLRSIQEDFVQMFGWNIAAAISGRRPITLSYRADASGNKSHTKSCILFNCSVSAHHAGGIITATGSLDIVFTE